MSVKYFEPPPHAMGRGNRRGVQYIMAIYIIFRIPSPTGIGNGRGVQ